MESVLGAVAGPLIGGLLGGASSGGSQPGPVAQQMGTETVKKDPWSAADPWLREQIKTGQQLQQYYQKNPFNQQQQNGYRQLSNGNQYINDLAPSLLGQMSNQPGFDRANPRAMPPGISFNTANLGFGNGQGGAGSNGMNGANGSNGMGGMNNMNIANNPFANGGIQQAAPVAPVAENPQEEAMKQMRSEFQRLKSAGHFKYSGYTDSYDGTPNTQPYDFSPEKHPFRFDTSVY